MFETRDFIRNSSHTLLNDRGNSRRRSRKPRTIAGNPFGGKLNRRQRIPYFVCKPPGDITPGAGSLGADDFRKVFDDENEPARSQAARGNRIVGGPAGCAKGYFPRNAVL